ncbi:MAG: ADP-forming succinate--CoA ligase subunit beta [Chloroflexota bacterium]
MNIHEYQAKQLLAPLGLPIPRFRVAATPAEARAIATEYAGPVVVKAQVLVGGRGKAGGVKLASSPAEAEEAARRILGMDIKGNTVNRVLVSDAVDIGKEYYLGGILDRATKRVVLMASAEGGVDIEEVARERPERIVRVEADPFMGLFDYQARELANAIGLPTPFTREFVKVAKTLYKAMLEWDATLVEINPLVITKDNVLWAVDAKMVLDDNAAWRHPFEQLRDVAAEDPYERQAREMGISYVHLDGNIGCVVNGAGLAMATMDVIKLKGGAPANFLDIGGGAKAEQVSAALRIILSDPSVKAVLFNIFGGITRGDEVARGIVAALGEVKTKVPMVVRLVGTNAEEGREILRQAKLIAATTMDEAAEKVVGVSRG